MSERLQTIESYADRLNFTSERLRNIEITDTHGEKALPRGWGSILMQDKETYVLAPEIVDSSRTPYEPIILLVPPELLGTHEATDPDDHIPTGTKNDPMKGYEGIDFKDGWHGSPLAGACYAVCKDDEIIESKIYPQIVRAMVEKGQRIALLDDIGYGDIGILDGHHRRRYAAEGPIRLKYVPVQIIPYLYDPSVVLRTWHADNKYLKAQQVFEYFKTPDKYAEAKKTKFGVIGTDSVVRRILDTQPNIVIPLQNLK